MRRALGVALGGALADSLYSALGVLGVTPVLNTYASVPPILYAISGILILVYGFLTARSQPVTPAVPAPEDATPSQLEILKRREMSQGIKLGAALIVLNPAAMVTWVLIIGQQLPPI